MGSSITFDSHFGSGLGLRRGVITSGNRRLETPAFFPIVNIMTGPPPLLANGGVYRHLKVDLLARNPVPGIMTQILHFTDYNVDRKGLERWLQVPIAQRISEETGNRPFLFVDSGGYRLLYNTGLETERFGIEPSVESIFSLQTRFGGDIVATLDYPLPRGLLDVEAKQRIKRSIKNCIETALLVDRLEGPRPLVEMAIHGRDRIETRKTVVDLLAALRDEELMDLPFGLAIGSLVPLSSSPLQVIDIVRGVYDGIRSCSFVDPSRIPVHAFGVSSRMIPFLAAMGVDTFDGSTYIQQAQQLRYVKTEGFSNAPFMELSALTCTCRYCQHLDSGGLEEAKQILRGGSFGKVQFAGETTNKSFVYALIALHNLQASLALTSKVRRAVESPEVLQELFLDAARDLRQRKTLAYFARFFPDVSEFLWNVGVAKIQGKRSHVEVVGNFPPITSHQPEPPAPHKVITARVPEPGTSLRFGPDAFDITKKRYRPPQKPVMLVLPCSQQKPYSSSPSHRFIEKVLDGSGVSKELYTKVSISGNYGPVPEEYEREPEVQAYDFYLSSQDSRRIELLAERTHSFLVKHGAAFAQIIAYCTAKPYREVIDRAAPGCRNVTVLPANLRVRKQSEFRKPGNVRQLVIAMQRYAIPAEK